MRKVIYANILTAWPVLFINIDDSLNMGMQNKENNNTLV